jgi:putative membrane protein
MVRDDAYCRFLLISAIPPGAGLLASCGVLDGATGQARGPRAACAFGCSRWFDGWAGLCYHGRGWHGRASQAEIIYAWRKRREHLSLLISWLINALALGVAVWLLPGIYVDDANAWVAVAVMAVIFGLVNALIRPLVKFLTCLINVITLGLFTLVINALMLWLSGWIAQQLGVNFKVDGFLWALIGGLVISVVSFVLNLFFKRGDD